MDERLLQALGGRGHRPLRVRTGEEEPNNRLLVTTAVRAPMRLLSENS